MGKLILKTGVFVFYGRVIIFGTNLKVEKLLTEKMRSEALEDSGKVRLIGFGRIPYDYLSPDRVQHCHGWFMLKLMC